MAVLRESELRKIDGGLTRVLGSVIDEFVYNPAAGVDFNGGGILLTVGGIVIALRCVCSVFLGDEPALKEMFCTKGHQGVRCCALCANICLKRYFTPDRAARGDVESTALDYTRFRKQTDGSVRLAIRTLSEEAAKKGTDDYIGNETFNEMELRLGFNDNPHNFAKKPYVHMVSGLMFDWMHIYLVGGLLLEEFGLTMKVLLKAHVVTYASLRTFLDEWVTPCAHKVNINRLFDKKASKDNISSETFKCGASEMLSLMPALAFYFSSFVDTLDELRQAVVLSLLACIDVVEMLQQIKAGTVTADVLGMAIWSHLTQRRAAHGENFDANVIKPHMAGHLPKQLFDHGTLYSCFIQERHHRLLTKYAGAKRNTTSYELGIVEEITLEQLQNLEEVEWLHCGLVNPGKPPRHTGRALHELGATSAETSPKYKAGFGFVHTGDAVFLRDTDEACIGEVIVLFQQDGVVYVLAAPWERSRGIDMPRNALRMDTTCRGLRVFEASCIKATLHHTRPSTENRVVIVKLPPSLRI